MTCLDASLTPRRATLAVGRESWRLVATLDDFSACDPSDYIRVFPRLLPRPGTVPVVLRAHITRCLAVLAWRACAEGNSAPMTVLCANTRVSLADMTALGAREHDAWFQPDRSAAVRSIIDETEAFALVGALQREMSGAALRPFDHATAALFSFTTGIHAAYLWPEALLSHEFFTAAGWLGLVWRCGAADMPSDLAEYFDDVIDHGPDGAWIVRDAFLARMMPGQQVKDEVGRAARRRLGGMPAALVLTGVEPRSEGSCW